jgi:hypothetical protein
MKTFAWAIIRIVKIGRGSVTAFVIEVESDKQKNEGECKFPSLVGKEFSFGCKSMLRCKISAEFDPARSAVHFAKPESDEKTPFALNIEYGVLISQNGRGGESTFRIIKGGSIRDLHNALGRPQEVKAGSLPFSPRTTKRRAI